MSSKPAPKVPLPMHWKKHVKSAILHVISLAQYATAYTRSWATDSRNARVRLTAVKDRLEQERALLREEIRIKDARMARLPAHRRPQYTAVERMATLATDAAQSLLAQLTWERVQNVLSEAELAVLRAAVSETRFTNSSLVKATGKGKQNVAKYINRFLELHLIHPAERSGRNVYYEISPDLALLRPWSPRQT
jgi:hypothetical protein